MEVLMAPWRYSYISSTNEKTGGCIFCDFPKSDEDEKYFILFRGATCFVILNAYPYSSGHLMVVPYRHTVDLASFSDLETLEFHKLTVHCMETIKRTFKAQGFNLGVNLGRVGGAGIDCHVHRHIVPRWEGDTNFMSVTSGTRVIPISLEDAYKRLKENW